MAPIPETIHSPTVNKFLDSVSRAAERLDEHMTAGSSDHSNDLQITEEGYTTKGPLENAVTGAGR